MKSSSAKKNFQTKHKPNQKVYAITDKISKTECNHQRENPWFKSDSIWMSSDEESPDEE